LTCRNEVRQANSRGTTTRSTVNPSCLTVTAHAAQRKLRRVTTGPSRHGDRAHGDPPGHRGGGLAGYPACRQ